MRRGAQVFCASEYQSLPSVRVVRARDTRGVWRVSDMYGAGHV